MTNRRMLSTVLPALASGLLLAGCAGASNSATLPHFATSGGPLHAPQRAKASVIVRVKVPRRIRKGAGAHYISASTKSISIAIYDSTHTTLLASAGQNLTPGSEGCHAVTDGTTCTLAIAVRPGSDTFDVTTYDKTGETGNPLSALVDFPIAVAPGTAAAIPLTLGGLAKSIEIVPPNVPEVTGNQASGFTIFGSAPLSFTIAPEDADQNIIVGPGAPQVSLNPAPSNMTVATPAPGSPTTWTLTSSFAATDPGVGASTVISAQATPVPGSGGVTVSATPPASLNHNWFYVSNCSSDSVSVFDDQGNAKTVSGLSNFSGTTGALAYDSHNGLLYAGSAATTVQAFTRLGNLQTLSGTWPGLATGGAFAIVYDSHNNELYVTTYANNGGSVNVYDEQGNAVPHSGTFPGLSGAAGAAFDPHNNLIYVANYSGSINVYDESGNLQTVSGSWAGQSGAQGIVYDPHNGLIYVSNWTGQTVTVYDENGNEQTVSGTWQGVDDPNLLAFDPHTNQLFLANYAGGVTAYDEQGNQATLSGFGGVSNPFAIAIVP